MSEDFHRAILNIIWSKQLIVELDLQEYIDTLASEKGIHVSSIQDLISELNSKINFLGLDIRRCVSEDCNDFYWIICNNKDDDISKLATTFTPTQISLFKEILNVLFSGNNQVEEEEGNNIFKIEITKHVANNMRMNIQDINVSAREAETTIKLLVNDGWLHENEGKISTGIRTIIELKSYLKSNFELEGDECFVCNQIVTKGEKCVNVECKARLHFSCSNRRFQISNITPRCPVCSTHWKNAQM